MMKVTVNHRSRGAVTFKMQTIKAIIFLISFGCVCGYFTLPGKCPDNLKNQEDFDLAEFGGTWYQAYHYSSDGQRLNNCSTVELSYKHSDIFVNYSRVDLGLFKRYSVGRFEHATNKNDGESVLVVGFNFQNAPRRLRIRRYPFHILATNYKYYATAYTCQYSSLINKHFIYIWILSRHPTLNDVSKELAINSLRQVNVNAKQIVKEDWSKCVPKYYDVQSSEPVTFRYPVPI